MKKRKQAKREGYIVRASNFQTLKRSNRDGEKKQTKLRDGTFKTEVYRKYTKITTYTKYFIQDKKKGTSLKRVIDEKPFKPFFKKRFSQFKDNQAKDFAGSVQYFSGKIKTVRFGRVYIDGQVTKSSHLYSVSKRTKQGKRRKKEALNVEFNNNYVDMVDHIVDLELYQYRPE